MFLNKTYTFGDKIDWNYTGLGFEVQGEVSTNNGRIDAVWTLQDQVIIAEVKFAKKGSVVPLLKNAFNQIYEKKYYERYIGNNRKISLLAIGSTGKDIACKMKDI